MEQNANLDYRNYFFPGPAFPMQIFPMSGNPRFPFSPSFGTANMNDLSSHVFPTIPGETISGEVVRSDPQGRKGTPNGSELLGPSHALVRTRNTTVSLTPLQVDEALRGLLRQLDKALAFCEKCLVKHDQVVRDVSSHAKKDARNSLWRGLLESRFDASDSDKDLFQNLPGRIEYCTQQVREAALADPSARSNSHDKRREFERLVLKIEQISAMCDKTTNFWKKTLGDRESCEKMVAEMRMMKDLCKGDVGILEKNDGDENNSSWGDGDTSSAEGW